MPKDITPPRRGFSFKDFSLSKPGQALPGDRLDTELDRLAGKFGDLEAFLLASFERDGSLKGNTIAQRHLTPGVFEPIVQRFHDAILKAQKDLALREKSTQNMAVEARLAKTDAAKAAQEAKDAVQEARSVNLQTHQAAQNANQARARAEAALIPLAATQSDAQTAANSARIAEDMAYRWAEKTDGPVFVPNGGDPVNDGFYSSKFWALFTKSTVENGSYWYLGASDTPPTTGNDGQPLQEGMWYFDTDQGQTFIWNGTLWEPISGAQGSVLSVFGRQGAVTAHANDYAAYYLTLTGGTLTGMLTLSASPTALLHASTKGYTDQQDTALDASLRAFIAAEDDALEATLRAFVVSEDDALEATLRAYTDAQVATRLTKAQADALYLSLLGGTLTGPLTLPGDPTQDLQAATKGYVDALVGDIPPGTSVGDAPPAGPEQGQLWYKTSAPVGLYVWYQDPDSSQWVSVGGGGGGGGDGTPTEIVKSGLPAANWTVVGDQLICWGAGPGNGPNTITFPRAFKVAPSVVVAPVVGTSEPTTSSFSAPMHGEPTTTTFAYRSQFITAGSVGLSGSPVRWIAVGEAADADKMPKAVGTASGADFATEAEAIAGVVTGKVMSPAGTAAAIDAQTLGIEQQWRTVAAADRPVNTPHQNATGRPIMLSLLGRSSSSTTGVAVQVSVDGASGWVSVGQFPTASAPLVTTVNFIVPPGHFWRVNGAVDSNYNVTELS